MINCYLHVGKKYIDPAYMCYIPIPLYSFLYNLIIPLSFEKTELLFLTTKRRIYPYFSGESDDLNTRAGTQIPGVPDIFLLSQECMLYTYRAGH